MSSAREQPARQHAWPPPVDPTSDLPSRSAYAAPPDAGRSLLARAFSEGGGAANCIDCSAQPPATASSSEQDGPGSAQPLSERTESDDVSDLGLGDRLRKRGRVESANFDHHNAAARLRGATTGHYLSFRATRAAPHHNQPNQLERMARKYGLRLRSYSAPELIAEADDPAIMNIFPDIRPRDLRIAEVRSWQCDWMDRDFPVDEVEDPEMIFATHDAHQPMHDNYYEMQPGIAFSSASSPKLSLARRFENSRRSFSPRNTSRDTEGELDSAIDSVVEELSLETKAEHPMAAAQLETEGAFTPRTDALTPRNPPHFSPLPAPLGKAGSSKRPQLRLKLEDMPTPQQAEERAQRAANRLIAKREAMEIAAAAASAAGTSAHNGGGPSAAQVAHMKLSFQSYNSSSSDSDLPSPSEAGRHSGGSAYSPNHGMFTTKSVAVSEAGISSPDAACLHLQENLERVKEVGRGASGVVYKGIHIPTLKVVAVKDVPVYGRGQRRQMVRELHALYSNLVPMSDTESPQSVDAPRKSTAKPTPSPYIVYFYDAFVDRPKNCICLVMEYMSTGSLQDIVVRGGCQNEKILARLASGVLRGLAHIHRKHMIHRDIKPHNLLTNRQGEVKISDFGLARTLNDNLSSTKTFVGTLLYMAPERIGGGDYSYSADIWSCGLALLSVALGRYPLPTQDGFFGLVDSVANEESLKLPPDQFSDECRSFVEACLAIEPDDRPSADELLHHPFLHKYTAEETLSEWLHFVDEKHLCDDRETDLDAFADAAYRHLYERIAKFSYQPQSDFGMSFMSQATPTYSRRVISIEPIQMSLQLGLASFLGLPVHDVYEKFEEKRCFYSDKLLEEYCYSPQSWTASPGINRRQQLFGSGDVSPVRPAGGERGSFWRKLHDGMARLGSRRKKRDSKF